MPQEEQYAARDLTFGIWRRVRSLARFVGLERASLAAAIDIDAMVFLDINGDKQPLALFELARDVGQHHKTTTAIAALARRAGVPAYCVLYRQASVANPCDPRALDIASFRVRRIHPRPESEWRTLPPAAFAEAIIQIRAWSARRLDAERLTAANDPRYDDWPPVRQPAGHRLF